MTGYEEIGENDESRDPSWIYEMTIQEGDRLVLSKKMLRSKAFVGLTGAAKQILLELYMRVKLDSYKPSKRRKRDTRFYAGNNGKLVLSYKSIHGQFGYSTATISRAIDQLTARGFISIVELGCGVKRQSHKIALIKNWQDYGVESFKAGKGKSDRPVNRGFRKKKRTVNLETTLETKAGTTSEAKAVHRQKSPKPP
jgi:DNA-binding MarR family transcriptional regulator